MYADLKTAQALLIAEKYTCVLCKGDALYKSTLRGVRPLMEFLDSGRDFRGFSAADKVIGKATAFLYCLLGVREIYAAVISRAALAVLQQHNIPVHYDVLADAILNHRKDGFCPMETATRDVSSPEEALPRIRETLQKLRNANA